MPVFVYFNLHNKLWLVREKCKMVHAGVSGTLRTAGPRAA